MTSYQTIINLLIIHFEMGLMLSSNDQVLNDFYEFLRSLKEENPLFLDEILTWEEDQFAMTLVSCRKKEKRYRIKKEKLLVELEGSIITNLNKDFVKFDKAFYSKLMTSCKNLWLVNAFEALEYHDLSREYGLKALKLNEEYATASFSFVVLNSLLQHYALKKSDFTSFFRLLKKAEAHHENMGVDLIMRKFRFSVLTTYLKGKSKEYEHLDDLYSQVISLKPKLKTFLSILDFYMGVSNYLLSKKQYFESIKIADEGIKRLEALKIKNVKNFVALNGICAQNYLHLCNYTEGLRRVETGFKLQGNSINHNYFALLELQLALGLRCEKFQEAYDTYLIYHNTSQKDKDKIFPGARESWKIYELYLYLLVKIGKVSANEAPKQFKRKRFRIGKFLNEVPIFSKDKRGMNISILIGQIMVFLAERNYEAIIDRMEALKSYSYRHVRKDNDLHRSSLFLQMLEIATTHGFDPKKTQWRTRKILPKLQVPLETLAYCTTEIEVIRYEVLWNLFLEIIENRRAVPIEEIQQLQAKAAAQAAR